MRILGFGLLFAGFLWIVWDCADGFVGYQHAHWIWQSQHLPSGETIKRDLEKAAFFCGDKSLEVKEDWAEYLT